MDTMTAISIPQILQARGLRPSPQRVAVYKYLCNEKSHPSVDMIFTALAPEYPTLSRTTIYQTLESLCECGLAMKLTVEADEMRFDAEMFNHGHFKCTQCGRLFDVRYPEGLVFPWPDVGFLVKQMHLYYHGICPACRFSETDTTP